MLKFEYFLIQVRLAHIFNSNVVEIRLFAMNEMCFYHPEYPQASRFYQD